MADRHATVEPVASVVQRLSVLLAAGVAPASSWSYLAEQPRGATGPLLQSVAAAVADGQPVARAIIDGLPVTTPAHVPAWRGIAAAWTVATTAGAPLAPTLRDFAASLRALGQVQRDLRSALAAPVATARMVMALPVVGVLFGLGLGFDTVGTLFATPAGLVCLGLGVGIMLIAWQWNRRLVAAAEPPTLTPGLIFDLMAIAVSGGASIERARAVVESARAEFGLADASSPELDDVLALSRRAGVPAAALLRSEADEARRAARSDGERRAAVLSVTLMLPLGLCVLPAFMLLGVAPLLISVISSTVDGL